ncbi:NFU1 iron-sulfur cluster protein [Parasponia andersonii]|uniref:NFU1 iron-sulfur cluster protein n=1 Tax=Parasponia andersonii TaxID=3476 RepID=A0A2P5DD83_PARAD|nr:NFU1 iron-sulfur cluster protein [Parasponia andersonii]
MAFRSMGHWKSMANGLRGLATSTQPKMNAYAASSELMGFYKHAESASPRGDFVPVYVSLGLIGTGLLIGLHTAKLQLAYSPNVFVSKTRRETLPEVVEPEHVLACAEKFVKKSFFRKVAHVQDRNMNYSIKDPTRGDAYAHPPRAETLKSVGVDPLPAPL